MIPRIDVEQTFNAVVKDCGGLVVSEMIAKSPCFENADYLFHGSQVVVELKCMEEDKTDDPVVKERLGRLWEKWRGEGLVSGAVPPLIRSRTLPTRCQIEMYRAMGESIRRRIKRANAQIRATKSALNVTGYRGLLLLGNNGNLILEPAAMMHMIYLSIKDHFHDIDGVVYFSGNTFSKVAGVWGPARFWLCMHRDNTPTSVSDLANSLSLEWKKRYDTFVGRPSVAREIGDLAFFNRPMASGVIHK